MTTNIIEFGRIYKEDLAQGNNPETVILADGQPLLMYPLLNADGRLATGLGGIDDLFVDVAAYATGGTGTSGDPWTGWDTATTWSTARKYVFRPGHYLATSTLLLAANYLHLIGSGVRASVLHFEPTADDTFLEFHNGASELWQCSLRNLSILSADSTYTKIAVDLVDTRRFVLEDVEISGTVAVGGTNYWSGGAGSIGLRTRGRDSLAIRGLAAAADSPVVVGLNPNNAIALDHAHWWDLDLVANGKPVITVTDGAQISNWTLDGEQAWVKGTAGLQWTDTAGTVACANIRIVNARWEQAESAGYMLDFNLTGTAGLYGLNVENLYDAIAGNGLRLRNVLGADIQSFIHAGGAGTTSLDANSTCKALQFAGCFFQTGSTVTTTGLTKQILAGASNLGGEIEPLVIYDVPTGVSGYTELRFGATGVISDGATIAHGMAAQPTAVLLTGTAPNETVTLQDLDATNITVYIKKADGSAGTAQPVSWVAIR